MGYNHRFLFYGDLLFFHRTGSGSAGIFSSSYGKEEKNDRSYPDISVPDGCSIYLERHIHAVYSDIFCCVYRTLAAGTKNESGLQIKHTEILWLIPVCLEILCIAYLIYEPTQKNYIAKFEDAKTVNEKVEFRASAAFSAIKDPSVYRVENLAANERTNNREANFGTRMIIMR